MTTMDGYIRVSRRNGRTGDSYITKDVQRDEIKRWAARNNVELGIVVEDENVSGAKTAKERKLERLLRRVERGKSQGIITYRLDRFSRSPRDTFESLERLQQAGARLVGVADGVDSASRSGELVVSVLAAVAREQWKQRRENWLESTTRAVQRGVHITALTPPGYVKDRLGRLVIDPQTAPAIRDAFRMRAEGASYQAIGESLASRGVRPASGNPEWSRQGVHHMIHNRVYLGEARGWKEVEPNARAHGPIVSLEEFEAAQRVSSATHPKDGSIAAQTLLVGLAKCAGCGHHLTITGTGANGDRQAVYYCRRNYASGKCAAPAAVRASALDSYVLDSLAESEDPIVERLEVALTRRREAEESVRRAEEELEAFVTQAPALDAKLFAKGVEARQRKLDNARRRLERLPRTEGAALDRIVMHRKGEPLPWWDDAIPMGERRAHLRHFIYEVVVGRAGGPGGKKLAERVTIRWNGEHDDP